MPHLSIRALGPLIVTLDGQAITERAYDKVWALLVYLAQQPEQPHRRDVLAGLLWPDQPETRALTNLRQALARLRQAIGDAAATPPFLHIDRSSLRFNAAGDYTLDVTTFTESLAACATHNHRHAASCAACAQRRAAAVATYQGAFLDRFYINDSDLFEEWATLLRESLQQQALEALAALVVYHEHLGNYAQALQYGERQLELDPWREEAYRQIMRLLALTGERSAALRYYVRCREVLEAELGVAPAAETTALYEQIRREDGTVPGKTDHLALPSTRRHNLPLQPTPFIGRSQELTTLADLIEDPQCRLLTLAGPGGSGKTRLALQAASQVCDHFADGATFVNLAPLNAAQFIAPAVAAALDFTLANHTTAHTELLHFLRHKELLLVLDNFEHLLAAHTPASDGDQANNATELPATILQHAPGVTLLVTSRERLNLQGEWVFDVGGLELPASPPALRTEHAGAIHTGAIYTGAVHTDAQDITAFEAHSAVALFVQTARRVQKEFAPTAADRAAIAQICHLVQGMPLALELAGAWARALSCREIAQEIAHSLGFLATTLRDLPARHRSLQAVFDHSWKLLTPAEQQVFASCSVFRGGFTREAAQAVAGATLPDLVALVDKSLLRRDLNGRYSIHELARQYAAARLEEGQAHAQARNRHLAFYMRLAEEAEPQIHGGKHAVQWHEWMELEHDNVRAALDWSLHGGEFEPGLRMVGALWEFWMNRGHAPEGFAQAERFLARPEAAARSHLRAKAAHTAGVCAFYHGNHPAALTWFAETAAIGQELGASGKIHITRARIGQGFTHLVLRRFDAVEPLAQEALQLSRELDENLWQGDAFYQLAILIWKRGDVEGARRYMLNSLACLEAAGNSIMRGPVLMRLGTLCTTQGDHAAARAYLQRSLAVCEELGDKLRSSSVLVQLGHLALAQGDEHTAEEYFTRAVSLTHETGQLLARINPLNSLGRLAQRQGDFHRARALHRESLTTCQAVDNPLRRADTLDAFACLAARAGQAELAVCLFGAVDDYLASTYIHLTTIHVSFDPTWRRERDRLLADARAQLGEAAFAAAWAAGTQMTLDAALALVAGQE